MRTSPLPRAHRNVFARACLSLLCCAATLGAPPPPAHAATLTVTNAHDAGPGSLRQALADAVATPGPDTVTFDTALSGQTIPLIAPLVVDSDVTVDGTGLAVPITLSGGGSVRVLEIMSEVTVTLRALAIADGAANRGGGIYHWAGSLTVADCLFSENTAEDWAGALSHGSSPLTVVRSTFTANSASGAGALYSGGQLTMTDSTLSGNTAHNSGGGHTHPGHRGRGPQHLRGQRGDARRRDRELW